MGLISISLSADLFVYKNHCFICRPAILAEC